MMKRGRRGFTLVEVMIVVSIIALIVAISIPNLLRVRHNANQSTAIHCLRTVATSMESYHAAQTPARYADSTGNPVTLTILANQTPSYIDRTLGVFPNSRQGYRFLLVLLPDLQRYFCMATPLNSRVTGSKQFIYSNFTFFTWRGGTIYAWDPDNPAVGWQPVD